MGIKDVFNGEVMQLLAVHQLEYCGGLSTTKTVSIPGL